MLAGTAERAELARSGRYTISVRRLARLNAGLEAEVNVDGAVVRISARSGSRERHAVGVARPGDARPGDAADRRTARGDRHPERARAVRARPGARRFAAASVVTHRRRRHRDSRHASTPLPRPATRGRGVGERWMGNAPRWTCVGRAAVRRGLPDPARAPVGRRDHGHEPGRGRRLRPGDRRAVRRRPRPRERGAGRVRLVRDAAVRPGHEVASRPSADLGGGAVRDGAGGRRARGVVGVAGGRPVGGWADGRGADLRLAGDVAPRALDHPARCPPGSAWRCSERSWSGSSVAPTDARRLVLVPLVLVDRDDRRRQRRVGSARDHRGAGAVRARAGSSREDAATTARW